jgi:SAM-dependent methyltransferase
MSQILETLKSINVISALDVATGRGDYLDFLVDHLSSSESFVGVDMKESGEWCSEHFTDPRVSFRQMDAAALDFEDEAFGLVAMSNSLHHMQKPEQVLAEMMRVLKPGGFFLFHEMVTDRLTPSQLTHSNLHQWWAKIDTLNGIPHRSPYTWVELEGFLRGLDIRDWQFEEERDLSEDPLDPETIVSLDDIIGRYQANTTDAALKSEGDALRKRAHTIGFHSATALVALGKKPVR